MLSKTDGNRLRHFQFGSCKAIDEHFIGSTISIEMLIRPTASWPVKLIMSSNVLLFFHDSLRSKLYKMGDSISDDTQKILFIFNFSLLFFLSSSSIEAFSKLIFCQYFSERAISGTEAFGENKMMRTNSFRGRTISVRNGRNCGDMISFCCASHFVSYQLTLAPGHFRNCIEGLVRRLTNF